MNTILSRITIGFLGFFCLLCTILATTVIITKQQKDDALIVNLSGRQRMLTQKVTKEVLIHSNLSSDLKDQITLSMNIFETTLYALKDGGNAPLNLRMTQFRNCPPAETLEINAQLTKVVELWTPFRVQISRIINSKTAIPEAIGYITDNNVELLSTMNKAVFMMQKEAEQKVALMAKIQGVAIAIGLVFFIGTFLIIRVSVVEPIKEMTEAADLMSKGILNKEIGSSGLKEISTLSKSLNRLRVSLKKLLQRELAAKIKRVR